MTSYEIHRFEFLPDAVELLNDDGSQWRVRLPAHGSSLDAGLRPDHVAALGALKDRIVGRLVCRFKDGTPAFAALYLDLEGHLHWGKPLPVPPDAEVGMPEHAPGSPALSATSLAGRGRSESQP